MVLLKKRRLWAAALGLAGLLAFGGCGAPGETAEVREPVLPKNDGAPAKLTVGTGGFIGTDEIEEIIKKYEADFPNTEIEISEDEPDIALFSSDEAGDAGWLMDLSGYKDAWELEGSVSNPAGSIMRFRGGEGIYAIPCQYDQIMLYYRQDLLDEYNEGRRGNERAAVDIWGSLLDVPGKLGEKGRIVIDREVRPCLFDAILWSWTDSRLIADWAAGYYLKDGGTIFSLESSQNAADAFKRLLETETETSDPMGDFIEGRACVYIGRGTDILELRDKMPGELGVDWRSAGLPQGTLGRMSRLLGWTAWGVDKDTSQPEKAVHFLWYLTNADNNTHMYMELADNGVKPIYREAEAYEPSVLEGCWQGEIELLNMPNYKYASPPVVMGESAGAGAGAGGAGAGNPEFLSLLSKLESGEIGTKEMLKGLDGEYLRLLEEYSGRLPWEQGE